MKLLTQLLLGYVVVSALMIAVAGVMYRSTQSLIDTQERVRQAHTVVADASLLMKLAVEMETGERGYAITGKQEFLEPYNKAKTAYETTLAELKGLVSDPRQLARLNEIDAFARRWQEAAALPVIRARRDMDKGVAGADMSKVVSLIEEEAGKAIMDPLQTIVAEFVDVEKGILAGREKTAGEAATRSIWIVILSAGMVIAIGALEIVLYRKSEDERRRSEDTLKRATAYNRSLIEASLDPLVTIGPDGKITDVNAATEAVAGCSRIELIGADFSDYFTEPAKARAGYQRVFQEGTVCDYGLEIRRRDGRVTPVLYNASVYRDEAGKVIGVFAAARDITKSKQAEELRKKSEQLQRQDWLKTGIARLNQVMSGDPDLTTLASKAISELATYLDAQVGALYVAQDGNGAALSLMGSYAYTKRKNLSNAFKPGEGLVGQAALEKQPILLKNVPEDYVKVTSALGERVPRFICVSPFINEGRVKGVIEVATLNEMTDQQLEYLKQAMPAIALVVESVEARMRLTETLQESQSLTEELQAQQEELKTANEKLEQQTQRLEESQERLKAQQVELQVTNEELEEKKELLDRQKRDMEKARKDVEKQAEELALASKYKSEFLANMSHELRTPLNSLLLLSGSMAENKNGNLTPDQVEAARIIHNGGMDLLSLINEILDLSKIEAGRIDLDLGTVLVSDLADATRAAFQRLAGEKGLSLEVNVADGVPDKIVTDRKRVDQIIKNLVANAVKFTEKGGVTVTFLRPAGGADLSRSGLSPDGALAIEVKDTGVGIPPEKHAVIFEAFRQADGSTTRRYGGTGLGLSISSHLARLLGGEIGPESEPGRGSTFTAYLPIAAPAARGAAAEPAAPAAGAAPPPPDSQAAPDASPAGRRPIEQVPDDRDLRKIEEVARGGARNVLVAEDDGATRRSMVGLISSGGVHVDEASTGREALEAIRAKAYDCVVLDLGLPDVSGIEFLDGLVCETGSRPPVIVCTARDLTREEERDLREQAASIVLKDGRFEERLLDEVSLFLHRVVGNMPERKRRLIAGPHNGDPALEGAKVLIVDDDTRTTFALSQLLADHGVRVLKAEDGEEALRVLQQEPDVDLVLMDIMMPVMDGYEAIGKIRAQDKFRNLPIIALTAKAMAEDRVRCLTAGASDYLAKPLDEGRLISMMRVWLYRKREVMPSHT